ncbi:DUF1570 domain-containing protein [Singulisphaera rosea]
MDSALTLAFDPGARFEPELSPTSSRQLPRRILGTLLAVSAFLTTLVYAGLRYGVATGSWLNHDPLPPVIAVRPCPPKATKAEHSISLGKPIVHDIELSEPPTIEHADLHGPPRLMASQVSSPAPIEPIDSRLATENASKVVDQIAPPPPPKVEAISSTPITTTLSIPTVSIPGALDAPSSLEPKRIRLRTEGGDHLVARLHGVVDDKISVVLPDGQLGFSTGLAYTDEPFKAATIDQIRDELTRAKPFSAFKVRQSSRYLVLYNSTDSFAEASNTLLEDLYKKLTELLRKKGLPVREPEFPLVAIIFRTEKDFRAHKQVDPEIQAYYEILSNRIYFYQQSDDDGDSPRVMALRKPQTVAHEGTHQILQNIGVQPRLSAWPPWLVEGLAEYCSPPMMTRKGAAWGGLGMVNSMHMATINDLSDPLTLQVKGASEPQIGRDPKKPLVEYIVTRTELTPTDYALSWALTHYLSLKRGPEFLKYLKAMSELPPMKKRSPEEHLADFRAAFGADLGKIDRAVANHLSKLKYDPLPYYAVVFEQPILGGRVRRAALVSRSPSVISQWLAEIPAPNGGPSSWEAYPFPTKARALLSAQEWTQSR